MAELSLTLDKLNLARARANRLQSDLDQTWAVLERTYAKMRYTQTMLAMTNGEMRDVADGRDCRWGNSPFQEISPGESWWEWEAIVVCSNAGFGYYGVVSLIPHSNLPTLSVVGKGEVAIYSKHPQGHV